MTIDRRATVIAAIKHRETALCPYTVGWEEDVGRRLDAYYGDASWRRRCRPYISCCATVDSGRGNAARRSEDLYGAVWRTDLRPFHLETPALARPSLSGYRFPDPERLFPDGWERFRDEACATIEKEAECFTVARMDSGLFERGWMLRGFVDFLTDVAAEPAFAADLVAAIAEHQERVLDRLLTLPVDGIMFCDDWGDQRGVLIGPDRWRELIKPGTARLYEKAKDAGKVVLTHCCGSIVDILPDVIEMGLDVVQSVQPEARGMNPYALKARFGNRITFWGGLGSQSIIPFGTPDELRAEVRKLAGEMTQGGGYVLAPAKALLNETPTENAVALIEEFLSVGEDMAGTERNAPLTRNEQRPRHRLEKA